MSTNVVDQLLSSGTNVATSLVAAWLLGAEEFGRFVIAYTGVVLLTGLQRAVVGEPLLTHISSFPSSERAPWFRHALTTAGVLGLTGGAAFALLGAAGGPVLHAMLLFAPWVPVVLCQDTIRYCAFSDRNPKLALRSDLVWAGVQFAVTAFLWWVSALSTMSLVAAWGVGALVATVTSLARSTLGWPWRGSVRCWFEECRRILGWRTVTSGVIQLQQQGSLVLIGLLLGAGATGTVRAVQLVVVQPAQTLLASLTMVMVPWTARLRAQKREDRLRRAVRVMSALFLMGSLPVFLLVPFAEPVFGFVFPGFSGAAELTLPLVILLVVTSASVPYQASLRGTQRMKQSLVVQLVALVVKFGLIFVAAAHASVLGAAWALTLGTIALFLVSVVFNEVGDVNRAQAGDDAQDVQPRTEEDCRGS